MVGVDDVSGEGFAVVTRPFSIVLAHLLMMLMIIIVYFFNGIF